MMVEHEHFSRKDMELVQIFPVEHIAFGSNRNCQIFDFLEFWEGHRTIFCVFGWGFECNEYFGHRRQNRGHNFFSNFSNTLGGIIMNCPLHIKNFACNTRNAPRDPFTCIWRQLSFTAETQWQQDAVSKKKHSKQSIFSSVQQGKRKFMGNRNSNRNWNLTTTSSIIHETTISLPLIWLK